jgi:hypothetical protein
VPKPGKDLSEVIQEIAEENDIVAGPCTCQPGIGNVLICRC